MNTPRPVTFREILESLIHKYRTHESILRDFCMVTANFYYLQDEDLMRYGNFPQAEALAFAHAMKLFREETKTKPYTDILGEYFSPFREEPSDSPILSPLTYSAGQIVAEKLITEIRSVSLEGIQIVLNLAKEVRAKGIYEDVDLLRVIFDFEDSAECHIAYINMQLWGVPASSRFSLDGELENIWSNDDWYRVGEEHRRARNYTLRNFMQISF